MKGTTSASDEKKCDSGKNGDVVDETGIRTGIGKIVRNGQRRE